MRLASSGPYDEGDGAMVDGGTDPAEPPLAYDIVFECKDKLLGGRLAQRLEDVLGPTYEVRRTEEVAGWAVTIEFPSRSSAERFFDSDFYRQFCIEARRSCRSAVLVVPLGPV
ncbi:MAG: DUF1330 domain-containing protein [Actinobacteria bacterium]|nr:DUF1330 domain-containing protein [Actinomycetota bacterium]